MVEFNYAGHEIEAQWGGTTINGLQHLEFSAPQAAEALYEGGTKTIKVVQDGLLQPITGSFSRYFDVYNSDWILKSQSTVAQTGVTVHIQHGTVDTQVLGTCIVTNYSYSYDAESMAAEENVEFMCTSYSSTST